MTVDCRIEVHRNNVWYKDLQLVVTKPPTIDCNNQQEIKKELRVEFKEDFALDLINDKLVPFLILDGREHQLGKYVAVESQKVTDNSVHRTLVAYDLTQLLQDSKIEERLTIARGTRYTDAIREQLILAGIFDFNIEASTVTLSEDREDWEPGESRLAIVNKLIAEISYNSVWCDNRGIVRVSKYKRPTPENVDISYTANEHSILYPKDAQKLDIFERPNVFKVMCENPEKQIMVATSVNNDPSNSLSTVSTGRRVLQVKKVDNVATQAELQNIADREKFNNMLATESVEITTGPNPAHDCFNILSILKDDIDGVYREDSWNLSLLGTGEMKHKIRRLVTI